MYFEFCRYLQTNFDVCFSSITATYNFLINNFSGSISGIWYLVTDKRSATSKSQYDR